ncbi:MAG: LD-carboxypeptidase, partial [Leptolyngbya sp.]|nr:LD-carboxypeptidase [Candidatus Melainabacteria bacterium]
MKSKTDMSRRELLSSGTKAFVSATLISQGMNQMATSKTNEQKSALKKHFEKVIKPRALKPGDRVSLLCPAGRPHNPAAINRAKVIVEEMGFKPDVGKNTLQFFGTMAGNDEQRLEDFSDAINDDSIAGIFCVTGGYGSLHLVDKIDWAKLAQKERVLVGGDDNCHLLLSAYSQSGMVSFCAPNLDRINSRESFNSLKAAVTSTDLLPNIQANYGAVKSAATDGGSEKQAKDSAFEIRYSYAPVGGTAEGHLIGGNLTAIGSLMGTPFEPSFEDSILFIEDINEDHGMLDRWFTHLYLAGALKQISGIAIGDFENCHTTDCFNMYSLEDLFGDRMKAENKPTCFGLPLGQSARALTAPIGIRASLNASKGTLQFLESA